MFILLVYSIVVYVHGRLKSLCRSVEKNVIRNGTSLTFCIVPMRQI